MSERADTAYSPRFREEEHSAAAEQIMAYFPKCDYGANETAPYKTRGLKLIKIERRKFSCVGGIMTIKADIKKA